MLAWIRRRANFPDIYPLVMDAELKKLKKLAAFMKKEGILSYKTPEIELHLAPGAMLPTGTSHASSSSEPSEEIQETKQNDLERAMGLAPGASKALFWSTPGLFPEEAEQ